ncbi:hypothetical protein [Haloferax sp. DFSO52]|uniref:hypothetical protein n=1 Tax=Haloferax sp. DFSO52 TaxID=3388505 RepID=UPI003A8497A7
MTSPFPLTTEDGAQVVQRVVNDFEQTRDVFEPTHLPESLVIDAIGPSSATRERALFLTFTAMIDYRKETAGEDGLWQVMKRLWKDKQWIFEPTAVVKEHPYHELVDTFEKEPIMAWRDAHIWYRNAMTFQRDYGSDPQNLFADHEWNAPETLEFMRKHGRQFPYIKGKKIGSLWVRLIHEEVHPLEEIEEVPIPVDSRIRPLSKRIFEFDKPTADITDADIRNRWFEICSRTSTYSVRADQPFWLIEKYWSEWGQSYLNSVYSELE